jgi:hypothetical protein
MDVLKRVYVAFFFLLGGVVIGTGACGFDPQIADGAFACAADRSCPNGFVCAGDNKCYRPGNGPPVGTIDGGNDKPDSTPPAVLSKLQADPISLPEGNAAVPTDFVFTVRLDPPSAKEVSVDYATNDGTAKVNEDYAGAAGKLTFPPGSTSQTVTVKVIADRFEEPDEAFKLTLSNPVNAEFLPGAGPEIVATIKNDDSPGLAIDDVTVVEGDQDTTATLTVSLSGTYTTEVTVNFETVEVPAGTMSGVLPASEGGDFIASADTLTFAVGERTKTISIPIKGDLAHERAEGLYVKLTNPVGAPMVDDQATLTITDNDPIPTISIANATIAEGDDSSTPANMQFAVTLSAPSAEEIKVNFTTGGGTASGSDYATTTGTLTFAPGTTTQYAPVAISGDLIDEADETFDVTLSAPVNATIAKATATGTITDDDLPPVLTVENIALVEGAAGTTTPFPFVLTLSGASSKTVKVTYTTADVTATAGSDYVTVSQTVTFLPGETSKPATVTVNGDATGEGTETFALNLTNPENVTLAAPAATGTIINDDGAAAYFSISNAASQQEGNAGTKTYSFTITCTGTIPGGGASVDYATANVTATAGSDYVAIPTTSAAFNAGDCAGQTKTVDVTVNGDDTFEPNETFVVNLSNPTNTTAITDSQGVGTIENDDTLPIISIASVAAAEGDTGTKTFAFSVTLSNAASTQVSVNYATGVGATNPATAGTDYVGTSGTLNFAPGDKTATVNVTVNSDVVFELNETFNVTLSAPSANATLAGGTSVGVGTINNDDTRPTISINDVMLNEGNSGTTVYTFTISLSGPSYEPVSVNFATADGTATAGSDYTSKTGTAMIAAGSTSTSITVNATGDATNEASETFNVGLSTPTVGYAIADATGVGTITNDDQAHLVTITDASATEGSSMTFNVNLSPGASASTTVRWDLVDVTTSGSDHGSTITGTVTFSTGQTQKQIQIPTTGDNFDEADETFEIRLTVVSGDATISDGVGVGTIVDNDATPTIAINNVSKAEGDGGGTTNFTFTVTLSAASGRDVSVEWSTLDGTAVSSGKASDRDFTAGSGTLNWAAGDNGSKTITVVVNADDTAGEGNETFTVVLANPVNATLSGTGIGTGTITNDD